MLALRLGAVVLCWPSSAPGCDDNATLHHHSGVEVSGLSTAPACIYYDVIESCELLHWRELFSDMPVYSAASRSSVAFALTSCALSALLAFTVSGAVAAAYTVAYSAMAALTIDALRSSRTRLL